MEKKKSSDAYVSKTDSEIKELAMEMFRGNIITDRHIVKDGHDTNILFSVFLPLALSGPEVGAWMEANDIDLMYSKTSETLGGRSINGWPIFTTLYLLNKEDTRKMFEVYRKIVEAMENV
jgi:hypothetical protein